MSRVKINMRKTDCPITYTLDFIGDKWSLLIIRDLAFHGKKYFGDFQNSNEKIASNILTDKLQRLEAAGIISKRTDAENRRKIIYELTPKGAQLVPVIREAALWGATHYPECEMTHEDIYELMGQSEIVKTKRTLSLFK